MESSELDSILRDLAQWPRKFSIREAANLLCPDADAISSFPLSLSEFLVHDERFLSLGFPGEEAEFIPKRTLFRHYCSITVRLARAGISRLTLKQWDLLLSLLGIQSTRREASSALLSFGEDYAFIGPGPSHGFYVFPLANILLPMSSEAFRLAEIILRGWARQEQFDSPRKIPEEVIEESLALVNSRTVQVIREREGLVTGNKRTLEQIGNTFGVTRERIRQLENKFWKRFERNPNLLRPFVEAILSEVSRRKGRLVSTVDSPGTWPVVRFLARCTGIPLTIVPELQLVLLGGSIDTIAQLCSQLALAAQGHTLGAELDSLSLIADDVEMLRHRLFGYHKDHLNKAQRVRIALESIGEPAHYSDITSVYNKMFPDDISSDRIIHAVLSRESNGVCWIGQRGTFALEDWGYKKPSLGLFDTVTEIVKKKYDQTGKPVSFNVILAEIGRYRKAVKDSSLVFAAHLNPSLKRIGNDSFIPREIFDDSDNLNETEVDMVLEKFRLEHRH